MKLQTISPEGQDGRRGFLLPESTNTNAASAVYSILSNKGF